MKGFKLAELYLKIDNDMEIENIISIPVEMKQDCKGREEEIKRALEPVFDLFKDIIKNSEE